MHKFIKSKLLLQVFVATLVATLATVGIVAASTTIGNNIATGGNITIGPSYSLDTVSAGALNIGTSTANAITIGSSGITTTNAGALTVTGATTLSGTLAVTGAATFSNNLKVAPAYGLDVSSAGALNIGTSTATTINIGNTAATTAIKGNLTIPAAYSLDAAGVLNIGTSSATAITIGKSGITTTNAGALTVSQAATFSSTAQVVNTFNVNGFATTTAQGIIDLANYSASPATCNSTTNVGGLIWAVASKMLCVCNGSAWIQATTTGSVACPF